MVWYYLPPPPPRPACLPTLSPHPSPDGCIPVVDLGPVSTFFFFFFIPFIFLVLLSRSLPVVAQTRGHIAGPPLASPLRYNNALIFIARRIQHFLPSSTRVESCLPSLLGVLSTSAFSSRVDSRRIVPTLAARRSQQLILFFSFLHFSQ